jgi:hypothetical protein
MANDIKRRLLEDIQRRFGSITKLPNSQSLFEIGNKARIYIRYSKLHPDGRTFYALRKTDLQQLEGRQSLICFLWESQLEPLLVPYRDFEEVFATIDPASDGQFKAQVYPQAEGTELYIANAGRFNVESYFGWNETNSISPISAERWNRELTHAQVQTLLGSIGAKKGHEIWLPMTDRKRMDWNIAEHFPFPADAFATREFQLVASEIDVIWLRRGSREVTALFEVEHSEFIPVCSGSTTSGFFCQLCALALQSSRMIHGDRDLLVKLTDRHSRLVGFMNFVRFSITQMFMNGTSVCLDLRTKLQFAGSWLRSSAPASFILAT